MLTTFQATDTVLISVMHEVTKTSSNLIPPGDDVSTYSQAERDTRIFGSKLVLVVEQMQLITVWLVKSCLLIMYNRMTLVLPQHKIVIWTSVYVAVSFIVMEVLYLGVWCRPFSQYWALPTNSSKQILPLTLQNKCRTEHVGSSLGRPAGDTSMKVSALLYYSSSVESLRFELHLANDSQSNAPQQRIISSLTLSLI
jgi:hypothetical protein